MRACVSGLFGYLLCIIASARLYPGGTWDDRTTQGFSFWENFWCDLLSPVAIGGGEHRLGSYLARAAFVSFAFSMLTFWPLAERYVGPSPQTRLAIRLGRVCAISLVGLSAVPSVSSETGHAVLVVLSCLSGLAAMVSLSLGMDARKNLAERVLAGLVLVSSLVPLLQYVRQGIERANYASWLAGAQKIANGMLLLWMGLLLFQMWRAKNRTEPRQLTEARP